MRNGYDCDEDNRSMTVVICDTDISITINSVIQEYIRVTEDSVLHPQLKFQWKTMHTCDSPDFLVRTFRRGVCTVVMWAVHNYLFYQGKRCCQMRCLQGKHHISHGGETDVCNIWVFKYLCCWSTNWLIYLLNNLHQLCTKSKQIGINCFWNQVNQSSSIEWPEKKSIQGLTPGEVQDSNICNTLRHDYNVTRGCHRFYYLVPFTVFDSFSHPFLPCQCSFTFCVVWHINLRTVNATYSKKTRLSLNNFKGVQNNKVYKLMIYSTIIKSFTFYGV